MREVTIGSLCDRVNSYALEAAERLTINHPGVEIMFMAINSNADNLPEIGVVTTDISNDDVYELDLEYTDLLIAIGQEHSIDIYVEYMSYDGMDINSKDSVNSLWINEDDFRFYAKDGKFYED